MSDPVIPSSSMFFAESEASVLPSDENDPPSRKIKRRWPSGRRPNGTFGPGSQFGRKAVKIAACHADDEPSVPRPTTVEGRKAWANGRTGRRSHLHHACKTCLKPFFSHPSARYCSAACKQEGKRRAMAGHLTKVKARVAEWLRIGETRG